MPQSQEMWLTGETKSPSSDEDSGPDVTILYGLAGVYLFKGNATMLCRKSRWFRNIITENFAPSSTKLTITLEDDDDRAVNDMLNFIHEQPLDELHAESIRGLHTVLSAINLFKLADKYGVPGLEDVAVHRRFPESFLLYVSCGDDAGWNLSRDDTKQEVLHIIKTVYNMASNMAERTEHPLWAALWEVASLQDLNIGSKPAGSSNEVSLKAVLTEFITGDHIARSIQPYLHIGKF